MQKDSSNEFVVFYFGKTKKGLHICSKKKLYPIICSRFSSCFSSGENGVAGYGLNGVEQRLTIMR